MNLQPQDIQGQRICVITSKFLPAYGRVRVDELSGQIGLLFDPRWAQGDARKPWGSNVFSTNQDVPPLASLHWYGPELLDRIYEVKPNDLEFGLGCPLAVKEKDLAECRQFVCNYAPAPEQAQP